MLNERQKKVIDMLLLYMKDYKRSLLESELIDIQMLSEPGFKQKMYFLYGRERGNGFDEYQVSFQGWDRYFNFIFEFLSSGLNKKEFCLGDRRVMGKLIYELTVADSLTNENFLKNIKCALSIINKSAKVALIAARSISSEHVGYGFLIYDDGTFEYSSYTTKRTALEKTDESVTYFSSYPYPSLAGEIKEVIEKNISVINSVMDTENNLMLGQVNNDILVIGPIRKEGVNLFSFNKNKGKDDYFNRIPLFIMKIADILERYKKIDEIQSSTIAV